MSTLTQQNNDKILLESGTNEVEFIEFFIAGESYGINVSKVQRVMALSATPVTEAANAHPSVRGIVYVQKKPVALIDLRRALNIDCSEADSARQLVLVLEFNKTTTSYVIDGVNKIHRTSWKNFKPMGDKIGGGANGYTTGTITIEDRVILILDIERLMLEFSSKQAGSLPEDAESGEEISEERKLERKDIKVVYAEDSKIIRNMTAATLKQGGYTNIVTFENGQQAYDYIGEMREKASAEGRQITDFIDIVVTDIEMPELDGLTLCRQIKSAPGGDKIPAVIVYSSLINDQMRAKCKSVGADSQLSKPHGNRIIKEIDALFFKKAPVIDQSES